MLVGEAVAGLHFDFGFFAAAGFARGDVQNAIGIEQKLHFNAWQSSRHWRNAFQVEARQRAAILREFALALHDMNRDVGLTFDAGGEVLGCRLRNRRITMNDLYDATAERLDTERERSYVEQQHFLSGFRAATENVGLHGRAECHNFVGIQVRVWHTLELLFYQAAYERNARGAADENHLVNLIRGKGSIFHGLPDRTKRAIGDGFYELLKLRARDGALILRALGQHEVERCFGLRGQCNFRVDDSRANGLHSFAALVKVEAEITVNVVERNADQQVVDVVSAEMRVTVGGDDLEDAFVQLEDRDVERAAAKVVDRNGGGLFLVETVGE